MAVAKQSIEKQSLVQICGEIFDITEAPSADSPYVQQQLAEIYVFVSKLSNDLRDMGRFARIALYCAVVKGDLKLEENIREYIKRLAALCDDSRIATDRFEPTSPTFVIETLQAGYSNLLEGHEDMAVDNFDDVQHEAEEMEVISKDLYERFEGEGETLKTTKDEWEIEVSGEKEKMTKLGQEAKEQVDWVIEATGHSLMLISVAMLQVAGFWNRMAAIAKELQSKKIQNRVKRAIDSVSAEKRLKVWTSQGFKMVAIANYAMWVSCRVLCNDYMKRITTTRAELHACLEEPIVSAEAAKKLKLLLQENQQQQIDQNRVDYATTSGE